VNGFETSKGSQRLGPHVWMQLPFFPKLEEQFHQLFSLPAGKKKVTHEGLLAKFLLKNRHHAPSIVECTYG